MRWQSRGAAQQRARNDQRLTMLEVNSINLHYGAAQALRSITMKAEPGKVTCVLDALMGQHPVSAGSIMWEGNDITTLRPADRARRGIAYVPQGREIFPL